MTAPDPEFLTIAEAAAELRMHPQTVAKYIKAGEIPAKEFKTGNKRVVYRIPRALWDQYKAGTWRAAPRPVELIRQRRSA